jgi:hypothetical protein
MSGLAFAEKQSAAPGLKDKAAGRAALGNLRIGEPDDSFEREADRVADKIMAGGRPKLNWSFSKMSIGAPLQRKCSCGGSGGASGECEECKEKKEEKSTLQRKATGPAETGGAPPIVHEVLNSPGQPLDQATRDFFEPRFGHDFSKVRVHTGTRAGESAEAVGARAYSVGQNLVFANSQYSPHSTEGRKLLSHELVHAVQQERHSQRLRRFKVQDCDAGNKIETSSSVKDAHSLAVKMLGAANTAVNSPPSAKVIQAAQNHFKLTLPAGNDKDKKNWARAKMALSTMTRADKDATYECEPKQNWWNGACISGVEAISLLNIHLCPLWWQDHPTTLERASILLHEWGHKWGKGINRIFETYRFDKGYKNLSTEKRLQQPDAFMGFVFELWTGSPPNF